MEGERLLVAAGLTAAAVVGAYVFWGPATGSGSRRGRLAGLVNLGQTCFLNAILHALAACSQFVVWLQIDSSVKTTSLRATLATVLSGRRTYLLFRERITLQKRFSGKWNSQIGSRHILRTCCGDKCTQASWLGDSCW